MLSPSSRNNNKSNININQSQSSDVTSIVQHQQQQVNNQIGIVATQTALANGSDHLYNLSEKRHHQKYEHDRRQSFFHNGKQANCSGVVSPTTVKNIVGTIQDGTTNNYNIQHDEQKNRRHSLKRPSEMLTLSSDIMSLQDQATSHDAKRSCTGIKDKQIDDRQQLAFDGFCSKLFQENHGEKIANQDRDHSDVDGCEQVKHLVKTISDLPVFVTLEDYRIASYDIAGEPHLCLAQLLQYIKQKFPIEKVIDTFEETVIQFTSATPKQVDGFIKSSILPLDAKSCPLIRRSDADRVLLRLFDQSRKVKCNNILNLCSKFRGSSEDKFSRNNDNERPGRKRPQDDQHNETKQEIKLDEFKGDNNKSPQQEHLIKDDGNHNICNSTDINDEHASSPAHAYHERTLKGHISEKDADDRSPLAKQTSSSGTRSDDGSTGGSADKSCQLAGASIMETSDPIKDVSASDSTNCELGSDKSYRIAKSTASVADNSSRRLSMDMDKEKKSAFENVVIELTDSEQKVISSHFKSRTEMNEMNQKPSPATTTTTIKTTTGPITSPSPARPKQHDDLFEVEAQNSILNLARQVTSTLMIQVYHRCFGKCVGLYYPSLIKDSESECIECSSCHSMLTPRRFIGHTHSLKEVNICHWGFNSYNWRHYIRLSRKQTMNNLDDDELIVQFNTLQSIKDPNEPAYRTLDRPTTLSSAASTSKSSSSSTPCLTSQPPTLTSLKDDDRSRRGKSEDQINRSDSERPNSASAPHLLGHHATKLADQHRYSEIPQAGGQSSDRLSTFGTDHLQSAMPLFTLAPDNISGLPYPLDSNSCLALSGGPRSQPPPTSTLNTSSSTPTLSSSSISNISNMIYGPLPMSSRRSGLSSSPPPPLPPPLPPSILALSSSSSLSSTPRLVPASSSSRSTSTSSSSSFIHKSSPLQREQVINAPALARAATSFDVNIESISKSITDFYNSLDKTPMNSNCLSLRHLDLLRTFCNNQLGPTMQQAPIQQQQQQQHQQPPPLLQSLPLMQQLSCQMPTSKGTTANSLSNPLTLTTSGPSASTSTSSIIGSSHKGLSKNQIPSLAAPYTASHDTELQRDLYLTTNMASYLRSKGIDFELAGNIIDNTLKIIQKSRILF